jgi:hypothetical protein
MRYVALLIVVAIIYFAWSRRGPVTSVDSAMKEADAVAATATPYPATVYPPAQPAQTGQPSSGLRRPIDRTRAVMDQVNQRAAESSF